jgi:peptidoglycan hydrolase-like protein with peptidoglycan-binding domain
VSRGMLTDEMKQRARKRRERRFRLWLTTLSWATPALAFGGFFTLWHELGPVTGTHLTSPHTTKVKVGQPTDAYSPVLYQVGSQGPAVRTIQEQLAAIGYFHHEVTTYYGQITRAAVSAFQATYNLPETGKIDDNTLRSIQRAVRHTHLVGLTQPKSDASSSTQPSPPVAQNSNTGSASLTQSTDTTPVVVSSAS